MKVPFLGGAYAGRSSNVSAQDCVNLYYEPPPKHEQHDGSLVATPGSASFASAIDAAATPTLGDDNQNEVRGSFVFDDQTGARRLFFVIKNIFYEWDTSVMALTQRGSNLTTTFGRVSMAANNVGDLLLCDGSKGYILNGTTLTEITDADFVPTDVCVHQDGYFITTVPNKNQFTYSALLNGNDWPGTNIQNAEGTSDIVVSLLSDRRELWVFGDRTTEVFYNSGDLNVVFDQFQNGYIETGIAAKHSAAKFDGSVVWLGKNDRGQAQVVKATENWTASVISTPEVNYSIQQYGRVDDAFAYSYQMEGHEFYVITFPSANATWAYDALTQEWHRRSHTINGKPGRERYNGHVFYQGQHLMGDYNSGRIYALDSDLGSIEEVEGAPVVIPRVRTSPAIFADNEARVRISEFQLHMEEGVRLSDDVWLSYSKDGGHTWSSERPRSMGALGRYAARIIWRKLGKGRNWVFRIRTWSLGKIIIKGADARLYGERTTVD